MLTFFFITVLVVSVFYLSQRRKNLPPGPKGYPLIGNIEMIYLKNRKQVFRKLRTTYGDIVCWYMGLTPFVLVSGREAMKDIFVRRAELTSDRPISRVTMFSQGLGIVGSSGSLWKEQRTFAITTLRNFGFGKRSLENQIIDEVEVFMSLIDKNNGEPFDIANLVKVSISNIICSLIFGKRFEHDDKSFQRMIKLMDEQFAKGRILNFLAFLRFLPGDLFGIETIKRNFVEMDAFLEDIVNEHKKTLDENDVRDYIDAYLIEQRRQQNNENTTFTDKQLCMTIRNFFIAGTETTATTIRWIILFLMRHPEVQIKMRQEINDVIGTDTVPSLKHKPQLPYCEAVLTEGQRLSNIAGTSLPHAVNEDFMYNGYLIPKGATIFAHLDSLSHDPDMFPNPKKFDPCRFLSKSGECVGKDKFLPFSLGRRVCLGEALAKMEVYLFVLSMVQKFEFELESDEESIPNEDRPDELLGPKPYRIKAKRITSI